MFAKILASIFLTCITIGVATFSFVFLPLKAEVTNWQVLDVFILWVTLEIFSTIV